MNGTFLEDEHNKYVDEALTVFDNEFKIGNKEILMKVRIQLVNDITEVHRKVIIGLNKQIVLVLQVLLLVVLGVIMKPLLEFMQLPIYVLLVLLLVLLALMRKLY